MTALLRIVLTLALAGLATYAALEFRRWRFAPLGQMISRRQKRLRTLGFFFLLLVLGLWLRGTYLPTPHTRLAVARALAYWEFTALLVVPLIPIALLDVRENLHRALADRRRLRDSLLEQNAPSEPDS